MPIRTVSPRRILTAAIVPPIAATAIADALHPGGTGVPIAVYLVAVVVAASFGGSWSGLATAVLSSAGFIFFFTEPRFSFRIDRGEQIVTAIVFVIVALLVGALFARAVDQGQRAARAERDARLLSFLPTMLLSGASLQHILDDFARTLLESLSLARCEVVASFDDRELRGLAQASNEAPGAEERFPIVAGGMTLGSITVAGRAGTRSFPPDQAGLLAAAANQAGLAIERTMLDTRVREARMEADANELRAALFSSVTHDLKTPLASIKFGVTSLMTDRDVLDRAEQTELLETVTEETDRLDRLVGNILELARSRAGALVLERRKVGIDELIDAMLTRMRTRSRHVQIRSLVRSDVPDLWVDPVQMDQALTNVLENALAHSPADGVIDISVARYRSTVEIRIIDHGPGIPSEDRELVFDAFYRTPDSKVKAGSGLGLTIARAIVVTHGGGVRIETAPGGGTAVVISLPVDAEQTS